MYIGVSPSKFDQMIADGRMPKAVIIDGRRVWDRHELDIAFDALQEKTIPTLADGKILQSMLKKDDDNLQAAIRPRIP